MRLCYVAHPIAGDVRANIARARRWLRYLQLRHGDDEDTVPRRAFVAPYLEWAELLDEADPRSRLIGLTMTREVAARCDEFWPVGCRPFPFGESRWPLALTNGMNTEFRYWSGARPAGLVESCLRREYLFQVEPPALELAAGVGA